LEEPDAIADLKMIQAYMWWYASRAKGRLADKPTLTTLLYRVGRFGCMYQRNYKEVVPEETLDEVRSVSV
jgi:hypothetical protein